MKNKTHWTFSLVKKEALKYNCKSDFHKYSGGAYKYALKHNFLEKICSHMPKHIGHIWNEIKVKKEIKQLKCKTKEDLLNKSAGAYHWAERNKKLDDLFPNGRKLTWWSYESVKQEALKYKTVNEFRTFSLGAFRYAKRNKILNDICQHMVKSRKTMEKDLCVKIEELLIQSNIKYKKEVIIPKRDNKNGRIDFLIFFKTNFLGIEVKHSQSKWTINQIKKQTSKYKRAYREKNGFCGIFVVSDTKKYGLDIKQFKQLLSNYDV